jgi:hypothetical protein
LGAHTPNYASSDGRPYRSRTQDTQARTQDHLNGASERNQGMMLPSDDVIYITSELMDEQDDSLDLSTFTGPGERTR